MKTHNELNTLKVLIKMGTNNIDFDVLKKKLKNRLTYILFVDLFNLRYMKGNLTLILTL